MLGHQPVLPIDKQYGTTQPLQPQQSMSEYATKLNQQLVLAFELEHRFGIQNE